METRKFEKNPILSKILPAIVFSAGLFVLAVPAFVFIEQYGVIIAVALIILSFFVDLFVIFRAISSTNCPQCGGLLKRKSMAEPEYPCMVCGINWVLASRESEQSA